MKTTRPVPARARCLQHVGGAADVDRGVEGRVLERFADVDLGGEVEDRLGLAVGGDLAQRPAVADVELEQLSARRQRSLEVDPPPGDEVVDDRHLVAAHEQRVDQIRADESRSASYQAPHQGADPNRDCWARGSVFLNIGPESRPSAPATLAAPNTYFDSLPRRGIR